MVSLRGAPARHGSPLLAAVRSLSRCAQSRALGLDAECCWPGLFLGASGARRNRAAGGHRVFLGHPPELCLRRSGPCQAWKGAGRLGFLTALLGTGGCGVCKALWGCLGLGATAAVRPQNAILGQGLCPGRPGLSGM